MKRFGLVLVVLGLASSSGPAEVRAQQVRARVPVARPAAMQRAQPVRPPSIEEVVERLDDLYVSQASISRVKLSVTGPRRTRSLTMKVWTLGRNRALVVIESPARERGTATLKVERNLWNYLPRISKTIRVPPSMMLSSWMGSDFTNDDLVRSASFADDFRARVVGPSENPAGWLIRLDAKEGVVGLWKRIDFVVNEDGTLPISAKYYDRRMRHSRTMHFRDVREFDGRRVPSRMVLVPHDREGQRTELRYVDIDFDANVPASTFSLSRLEQNR